MSYNNFKSKLDRVFVRFNYSHEMDTDPQASMSILYYIIIIFIVIIIIIFAAEWKYLCGMEIFLVFYQTIIVGLLQNFVPFSIQISL